MSENALENLVLATMARGATAELRFVLENCEDAETARPIYAELRRLAFQMSRKYDFDRSTRRALNDLASVTPDQRWCYATAK